MGSFGRSVIQVPGPKSTNRLSLKDEGFYQHLLREYRSEKPLQLQENHRICVLLTSNAKKKKSYLEVGMMRRLLCLPVQQTLWECQTTFQSWRILLQRTHDSVPAKVPQLSDRRAAINASIVAWLSYCLLLKGWAGAHLCERLTKAGWQTAQDLQRHVTQVRSSVPTKTVNSYHHCLFIPHSMVSDFLHRNQLLRFMGSIIFTKGLEGHSCGIPQANKYVAGLEMEFFNHKFCKKKKLSDVF